MCQTLHLYGTDRACPTFKSFNKCLVILNSQELICNLIVFKFQFVSKKLTRYYDSPWISTRVDITRELMHSSAVITLVAITRTRVVDVEISVR